MLNYNSVKMRYEPYPLAVLRPALDEDLYPQLVAAYPATAYSQKCRSMTTS